LPFSTPQFVAIFGEYCRLKQRQFVAVFGDSGHPKWRMTIVAILVTVAAENGDYRRQKWRQFVAFLATIVAVTVTKIGVVDKI